MSLAVAKAITKRIRIRMGGNAEAAAAAGVSPSVWSTYENADRPESIPLGRLLDMPLTRVERQAIAALFSTDGDDDVSDLLEEAGEAVESVAELHKVIRLAKQAGDDSEATKRVIRDRALSADAEIADVLKAVS